MTEVRKQDGKPYPLRSIHLILAGIQRYILETKPDAPKLFDQGNSTYRDLRRTCDSVFRQLRSDGIGADVNRTSVFTPEEEQKLWDSRILATDNPTALQRTVFFYIGKCYCIRGGDEQRNKLGPSNFKRSSSGELECYTYIEHGSKNRSGGLQQLKVENKTVPCYALPEESRPRCLVYLLDIYFQKMPFFAYEKDVLYCRSKKHYAGSSTWYEAVPAGKNKLGSMVKDMCLEAGVDHKTNHSLRATGATTLFHSNVPEKMIQNVTGHRSLEALRKYERTSDEQNEAVSEIMMSGQPLLYEKQLNIAATSKSSVTTSSVVQDQVKNIFDSVSHCNFGNITVNIGSATNKN